MMGNIQLIYSFDYPFFSSSLFSRLLTSAPLITDNALLVLKRYCQDEVNKRFSVGKFDCLIFRLVRILV